MREVLRSEYMVVSFDQATGVVRAIRSGVPLPDVEHYERLAIEMERLYTRRERAQLRFLMDMRAAPIRSDDAFETRMREIGARIVAHWSRYAMLVRTAVGKLQMTRQSRLSGTVYPLFDDEAAALAYLAGNATPAPRR